MVEIYITKHPTVQGETSNIEIEAMAIKDWLQDVREGERKDGERSREEEEEAWRGFVKTSLVAHS